MKNTENVTIVLLLVTAVILGAMLIGSARADTPTRFGRYILCTGAHSESKDLLYIIDVETNVLNVYEVNTNKKVIEMRDSVKLDTAFRI